MGNGGEIEIVQQVAGDAALAPDARLGAAIGRLGDAQGEDAGVLGVHAGGATKAHAIPLRR